MTAIALEGQRQVSGAWLQEALDNFRSFDDVFRNEFLQVVVFLSDHPEEVQIMEDAQAFLQSQSTEKVCLYTSSEGVKQGLFVAARGKLASVYKLYDDTQGAFLHSLIAHEPG